MGRMGLVKLIRKPRSLIGLVLQLTICPTEYVYYFIVIWFVVLGQYRGKDMNN